MCVIGFGADGDDACSGAEERGGELAEVHGVVAGPDGVDEGDGFHSGVGHDGSCGDGRMKVWSHEARTMNA